MCIIVAVKNLGVDMNYVTIEVSSHIQVRGQLIKEFPNGEAEVKSGDTRYTGRIIPLIKNENTPPR